VYVLQYLLNFTKFSYLLQDSCLSICCIFRTVHKPDMYPKSYEEAKCLCEGCIINGVENMAYNSVPVQRSMLFLKKVSCPSDPNKYSLEYEHVLVTVACTCVVPRQ